MANAIIKSNPYVDIFEQFIVDASFLWVLRSVALKQPHYLPAEISDIERRIDNNLNGLFTSPDDVWSLCEDALELQEPGEVFTCAIVAFRSLEIKKIQQVVGVGLSNDDALKGLVSALAWLPSEISIPWIEKFIRSKDLDHKYLGICACSALRKNPGELLSQLLLREDCQAHEKLYARCLRLAGELKRTDLVPQLEGAKYSENETIQFWSIWSLILLGNRSVVQNLEPFIFTEGNIQTRAINLYFRVSPVDAAKRIISELSRKPENTRIVIKASGILGDPQVIPWLISKMDITEFARVAAEAFTQITGIFLEENDLALDVPEIEVYGNDDSDDGSVDMDEDENLPWPDVAKIKAVWQKYGNQFVLGQRYFLGKNIHVNYLQNQIKNGFQRNRYMANLELSLIDPSLVLVNIAMKITP